MGRLRGGIGRVLGGFILALALGAGAWGVWRLSEFRGRYDRLMFEPRAEDQAFAAQLLEAKFGTGITNVFVPRVDRDINAIYATAQFSAESKTTLAPGGRTRQEIGPGVVEFRVLDPKGQVAHNVYLRFTEGRKAFLAIVPANDRRHIEIVESRFASDEQDLVRGRNQS
jgi:hypothetical protein